MDRIIQPFGPPTGGQASVRATVAPPLTAPAPPAKGSSDYLRALKRRSWLVVAVALAAVVPGTVQVLRQPDTFRAYTRIKIEPPRFDERVATIVPHAGVGQAGRDSIEHYVPDQLAELRNPALAERVAADPALNFTPGEIAEAVGILGGIQTRQQPNSNTFDVYLEGKDPARVAALLNALLAELAHRAKIASSDAIEKSKRLASDSLRELQGGLDNLDRKINQMLDGSNLFAPGGKSLPEMEYVELKSLLAQKRARYDELVQQQRLERLVPKGGGPGVAPAHPYAQKIEDLQRQKEDLQDWLARNRRMMRHPDTDPVARNVTRMLHRTLDELERLKKNTLPDPAEADFSDLILAHSGEEIHRLEKEVKGLLDQMQKSMPQYQNYLSLLREREQKQASLVTMQERLGAFNLLAATSNEPVQVPYPAEEPATPVRPNRRLNLALVLVLGLALGVGLVCLLEAIDRRIKVPEHLSAGLTLPLFGVVPRMRRLAALHRAGHLWTLGLPNSVEADAFRNLRASLLGAAGMRGRPIVTLLVTSAKPGEGKSTTALNLAATCARAGERTLLLEADLRRPSLGPVFEENPVELGLVDVLRGDLPWQRTVVRSEIPNLDFLPAGDPTDVPIEILGTLELAQLLKALAGHYHRVIVDAPAVLGLADCRMLGRVVDAALLVVRSGAHPLSPLQRAKQMLELSRVTIAGVVFNGLDDDLDNWGGVPTLGAAPVLVRSSSRGLDAPAGADEPQAAPAGSIGG